MNIHALRQAIIWFCITLTGPFVAVLQPDRGFLINLVVTSAIAAVACATAHLCALSASRINDGGGWERK